MQVSPQALPVVQILQQACEGAAGAGGAAPWVGVAAKVGTEVASGVGVDVIVGAEAAVKPRRLEHLAAMPHPAPERIWDCQKPSRSCPHRLLLAANRLLD
jgi:hypothetical protein